VIDAGRVLGLDLRVRVFPEGTRTAADAAAAIGCPVSAIVKSLVFVVDDRPVVALVPGDLRLDPAKLAVVVGGERARRASLEEVRAATGYAAGGTPPFGHTTGLEVIADRALRRHDEVWAAAGTPTAVFPISIDALIAASGARWGEVSEG
jgi:prolyl-tRNA editing enzyme YbaK/EbsC (Cys-tRNA(Pro) deacylase)